MSTPSLEPRTDFIPADEFVVKELDTLKILSDPLRLRILELMIKPCTVKQVAEALNLPPTKLYYHISQLEKRGLIVLVDTRIVSGIIEKHYQVVAKTIRVDKDLLSPSGDASDHNVSIAMTGIFENVKQDLLQSVRDGAVELDDEDERNPQCLVLHGGRMFLTETQANEFYERFHALLKEFYELSSNQHDLADTTVYRAMHILFPTSSRPHAAQPDDTE